jgi:hypothetical protein
MADKSWERSAAFYRIDKDSVAAGRAGRARPKVFVDGAYVRNGPGCSSASTSKRPPPVYAFPDQLGRRFSGRGTAALGHAVEPAPSAMR